MLLQKIPDEAAYFTRCTRIERIAQRYEAIPVGCRDPHDQLAVLQVLLLRFLLVSHGIASPRAHILLRHLISFVYARSVELIPMPLIGGYFVAISSLEGQPEISPRIAATARPSVFLVSIKAELPLRRPLPSHRSSTQDQATSNPEPGVPSGHPASVATATERYQTHPSQRKIVSICSCLSPSNRNKTVTCYWLRQNCKNLVGQMRAQITSGF